MLTLNGDGALGGTPLSLDVAGPFQRDSAGHFETDLTITLTAAAKTRTFGLDIVDGTIYVGAGGTFYELPANALHMPGGATGASGAAGLFASLGIDPRSWLTDPHDAGTATVGGVDTDHFTAGVDAQKLFADLSTLITQPPVGRNRRERPGFEGRLRAPARRLRDHLRAARRLHRRRRPRGPPRARRSWPSRCRASPAASWAG